MRRGSILAFWLVLLIAGGQEEKVVAISVDVHLVVLQATVRDRNGDVVSGLQKEQFEIFDEGERQTIRVFHQEDIAVTVGLVVDHSRSMRRKLKEVELAARTFLQLSNPQDEVFVVHFSDSVKMGLEDGVMFSNHAAELTNALQSAPELGRTALYDGVVAGLKHLERGTREKHVLLVVSDGEDTASVAKLSEVMDAAKKSKAIIYAIALFDSDGEGRNTAVLRRMTEATGGAFFRPQSAERIPSICGRIASDIRRQYTLGYLPSHTPKQGEYRRVRVTASMPGKGKLEVRTRTGYFAGGK